MHTAAHTPEEPTDEALAMRAQAGDRGAFGVLVERYAPKLLRYARRFLRGGDGSDDAVQESFLNAYRNLNSFDTTRRFSPWMYRITHNELVSALRRRGTEPMPFFDPDAVFPHLASSEDATDVAKRGELRRALEGHLDALDAKYREVLVLHYFEDLDYREIADVLQIPVSTVGVRLMRARNRLEALAPELRTALHA